MDKLIVSNGSNVPVGPVVFYLRCHPLQLHCTWFYEKPNRRSEDLHSKSLNAPSSLHSHTAFRKIGRIIGWHQPAPTPLSTPGEILDPPLWIICRHKNQSQKYIILSPQWCYAYFARNNVNFCYKTKLFQEWEKPEQILNSCFNSDLILLSCYQIINLNETQSKFSRILVSNNFPLSFIKVLPLPLSILVI